MCIAHLLAEQSFNRIESEMSDVETHDHVAEGNGFHSDEDRQYRESSKKCLSEVHYSHSEKSISLVIPAIFVRMDTMRWSCSSNTLGVQEAGTTSLPESFNRKQHCESVHCQVCNCDTLTYNQSFAETQYRSVH